MITDARVLRPEFVPSEVAHRDPEVNQLSKALEPVTDGEPAETALLFGPSGAGKTCIAEFAVDRLRETALDVERQYVNCWRHYSAFECLRQVLEGVGGHTADVHRRSTPTDELTERIRAYDGPQCVVILDEVDQLEDKDLLYDLHRVRELSLVLIANREADLFAQLDDRLVSRLHGGVRIRFDRYGIDELVAILADRVRWGLTEGAVTDAQLERIADAAAGDARKAIGILRTAAREADREGLETVTDDLLADAVPEAREQLRRTDVDRLTPHQRAVYEALDERGELAAGELYEEYRTRVEDPKHRRTVRRYLSKLEHYDLVAAEGEKRGRTYRIRE